MIKWLMISSLAGCAAAPSSRWERFIGEKAFEQTQCPPSFTCEKVAWSNVSYMRFFSPHGDGAYIYMDGRMKTIYLDRPSTGGSEWEKEIKGLIGGKWRHEERVVTIADYTNMEREAWNDEKNVRADINEKKEVLQFQLFRR